MAAPEYTVQAYGTDSSGRTIFATKFMWDWWRGVCADLGFTPTIVQGAFMVRNGGGAAASAGYHDQGGCFDLRTWDLSPERVQLVVRTLRLHGAAAWLRDQTHGGFDPHIHFVLGDDEPLAAGAAAQWRAYLAGRDGLASNGPDYHWRPVPLVIHAPEDDLPLNDDDKRWIAEQIDAAAKKAAAEVLNFKVVARNNITVRAVLRELLKGN